MDDAANKTTARISLSVPFHDCDPLFVSWHGNYLKYFEHARCALLAQYRLDVPDVRSMGYRMYITDARCRYTYPAGYGDELAVEARLIEVTPLIRIAYKVRNVTQARASARGYTKLATTDAHGKLLTKTPDDILSRFPELK